MHDRISLLVNKKINPLVIKANSYLVEKYSKLLKDLNNHERKIFLEQKWQEEFGVKIEKDKTGEWQTLHFVENKHAAFMFYLRFDQ